MYTLFHHPFCPQSRFIRLALGEYGLDLKLVEERAWERREAFLALNSMSAGCCRRRWPNGSKCAG